MFGRRVARTSAALAFVGLAIVGCSAAGTPNPPTIRQPTSPTASPTVSAPPEPALNGVIATGTFTSLDGHTTGDVVLTATGNVVTASLRAFQTPATGQIDLQLSPYPLSVKCAADSWSFVMNQDTGSPDTWMLPILGDGPFAVDPTYLRTVIVHADAEVGKPNADGCAYPPLAAAELSWKLAPSHAGLIVSDQGTRDHARGDVTMTNGQPATYTVAPGDTLEAIESRFGITADDLHYLNPFRAAVTTETLRYGTVYNLSPTNRGAPPS